MENYQIKTASKEDMSILVNWAEKEGWNPGVSDGECYHFADPGGFFIGWLGDCPISCISAVRYDSDFGFIGFYIVRPDNRGKGYGLRIWQYAMQYLGGCNIALDGVVDQQANYRKSGFVFAFNNFRYELSGTQQSDSMQHKAIRLITRDQLKGVVNFDENLFPAKRALFLQNWLAQDNSVALGYYDGDRLVGHGLIRPCKTGYKIGPLHAENKDIADALLSELRAKIPQTESIFVDAPDVNQAAIDLVKEHKGKMIFETARMYTREVPNINYTRIFSVTSFEIGG